METSLKQAASTALDLGRDVKDSVVELARKIDSARDQTGDALHDAASSMRRSSAKIDNLAKDAAKRLDATASFVEDANLKGLGNGVQRFAQNHLTFTLLVAAAAGFWAATAFSRATRA